MGKLNWLCEECSAWGFVEMESGESFWDVADRLEENHKGKSPECTVPWDELITKEGTGIVELRLKQFWIRRDWRLIDDEVKPLVLILTNDPVAQKAYLQALGASVETMLPREGFGAADIFQQKSDRIVAVVMDTRFPLWDAVGIEGILACSDFTLRPAMIRVGGCEFQVIPFGKEAQHELETPNFLEPLRYM